MPRETMPLPAVHSELLEVLMVRSAKTGGREVVAAAARIMYRAMDIAGNLRKTKGEKKADGCIDPSAYI
jgi:hypothetical protein